MRISVLGSGSGGNAVLVATDRTALLVDAGLAPRELRRRIARLEDPPPVCRAEVPVTAVCVTHEHADHARYASSLAMMGVPIHGTAGTLRAIGLGGTPDDAAVAAGGGEASENPSGSKIDSVPANTPDLSPLRDGIARRIGDLSLTPVGLPHDAAEPIGVVISDGVHRLGVITDCGHPDASLTAAFAGVDLLVLEFNHDEMLLRAGPYPPSIKRRIASSGGHLSNRQAATLLGRIMAAGPAPRLVVLAHLSKVNNRPRIALGAAQEVVGKRSKLVVAAQEEPTPWLDPAAHDGRAGRGEQLTLRFITGG